MTDWLLLRGGTQLQIAAAKTRLPPSVDIDICAASEKRPLAKRIYADRSDGRFQPDDTEVTAFTTVDISDVDLADTLALLGPYPAVSRIQIMLENDPCPIY